MFSRIKIPLFFLLILCLQEMIFSQDYIFNRSVNPFPVYENEQPMPQPFLGGFNAPIQQWADIDSDGDLDLFISDEENGLTFYRNDDYIVSANFSWVTDYYQQLQVGSWFKFSDIDNDDDLDLFTERNGRIRLYSNTGDRAQPIFVLLLDTLKDINGDVIGLEGFSIPDWTDIDCDGDADLFIGLQSGRIKFYEHVTVDSHGYPVFQLISRNFQDLEIITGGNTGTIAGNTSAVTAHHGNNSITFADINQDLDADIFWGDFFASSIVYFENFGSCANPRFFNVSKIEQYPEDNPLNTSGFNLSRFGDIDKDGDLDMLVSTLGGSASSSNSLVENLHLFINEGSAQLADFHLQTSRFLRTIDIGKNSIPAFVDIDADGDQDLFIANEIDPQSPDQANSRLHFYENSGSPGNPVFNLLSSNYLNFDNRFYSNFAPDFADIDADGDYDLFLGGWNGEIIFFENAGSALQADFVLSSESFFDIDVGSNSAPAFADMDADGDLDLLVGAFNGYIHYYKNIGHARLPDFELISRQYFSIETDYYCVPAVADLNRDGLNDILVGSDRQGLMLYENRGSAQNADFRDKKALALTPVRRAAPVLTHLFSKVNNDLFVGTAGGGLAYYENNSLVNSQRNSQNSLLNYPNPFRGQTEIIFTVCATCSLKEKYKLNIYDVSGRLVNSWSLISQDGDSEIRLVWDGKNQKQQEVSSGLYFASLTTASQWIGSTKLLLLK